MTDAGFFKGTSTDQDSRFADKRKKLMKSMKFGDNLNQKVDTQKVNVETIKPWIVKRITELLAYEDDIVCEYVMNMLSEQSPDPKDIQINLTAFLGSKNARIFVTELWDLMLSAMTTAGGAPAILLEAKKAELLSSKEYEDKFRRDLSRPSAVAPDSSVLSMSAPVPPPTRDDRRERRRYTSSPDNDRPDRGRDSSGARFRDNRHRDRHRSRSPSDYYYSTSRRHHKDRRSHRRERRRSPSEDEERFHEKRSQEGPMCVPREGSDSPPNRQRYETTVANVVGQSPPAETTDNAPSRLPSSYRDPDPVKEPEPKRRRDDDHGVEIDNRNRDRDEYIEESRHPRTRSPDGYVEERRRRRDHASKFDERRHRDRPYDYVEERRPPRRRVDESPPRRSYRDLDDVSRYQQHRPTDDREERRRDSREYKRPSSSRRDSNADFWEEERSASRSHGRHRERRRSSLSPPQQKKAQARLDVSPSPEGPALPHDLQKPSTPIKDSVKKQRPSRSTEKHRASSSSSSSGSSDSSTDDSDSDSSSDSSSSDSTGSSSSYSGSEESDKKTTRKRKLDNIRIPDKVKKHIEKPSLRKRTSPSEKTISTKRNSVSGSRPEKHSPEYSQKRKSEMPPPSEKREPSLPPEGPSPPDPTELAPTEWKERGRTPTSNSDSVSSSGSSSDSSDASSSSDTDDDSSSSSSSSSSEDEETKSPVKKSRVVSRRDPRSKEVPSGDGRRAKNGGGNQERTPSRSDKEGDEDHLRRQALESLKRRRHCVKDDDENTATCHNGKGDGDTQ